MHTARRAAASITDAGEDRVAGAELGKHFRRRRTTEIVFAAPDDFADGVPLPQAALDVLQDPVGVDLAVVEHANERAFERHKWTSHPQRLRLGATRWIQNRNWHLYLSIHLIERAQSLWVANFGLRPKPLVSKTAHSMTPLGPAG